MLRVSSATAALLLTGSLLGGAAHGAPAPRPPAASPAGSVRQATAVVLGSTYAPGATAAASCGSSTGSKSAIPVTTAIGEPSYVVPADGVLTSFSYSPAVLNPGNAARAVLVRKTGASSWAVDARSDWKPLTTTALNTFAVRVPAHAGEVLALSTTHAYSLAVCGFAGGGSTQLTGNALDGPTFTANSSDPDDSVYINIVPNISAVLEPDADHDGYGDLTQDGCPGLAAAQGACPVPDTAIKKRPQRTTQQHKVKVTFISTVLGSSFECTLDKKKPKPCTSPFKAKVGLGSHRLVVRAVVGGTTPDPSPAKVRWRVVGRD